MFSRYCLHIALFLLISTLSMAQVNAFQVANGGTLRAMQTGNPGSSASFTVNSKLRIEGRGVVIEENNGAVDWGAIEEANRLAAEEAARQNGGSIINTVISVCDASTNKCGNIFPTGSDQAYEDYTTCISSSSVSRYTCARQWARDKDLLVYEDYLVLKGLDEPNAEVVVEDTDEAVEEFQSAAPEAPASIPEKIAQVVVPQAVAESPVVTTPKVSTPAVAPKRTSVPVEVRPLKEFSLNLQASTINFPSFNDPKAVDVDINLGTEYYSCINVPRFVVYNDLWKWLAYRLLFVLTALVAIIFLLAFWVFLLWRSDQPEDPRIQKKKND